MYQHFRAAQHATLQISVCQQVALAHGRRSLPHALPVPVPVLPPQEGALPLPDVQQEAARGQQGRAPGQHLPRGVRAGESAHSVTSSQCTRASAESVHHRAGAGEGVRQVRDHRQDHGGAGRQDGQVPRLRLRHIREGGGRHGGAERDGGHR